MPDSTARRTSARPMVVSDITFYCYHIGILRYEWRSHGGRFVAGRRSNTTTYYARVGDETIPKKFRSLKNAMKAAIAAGK